MLHVPSLTEDAKHFSLIVTSAIAAVAASGALFAALQPAAEPEALPLVVVEPAPVALPDARAGADRLYGVVHTAEGAYTGYLRWNGRESSWADVMPATRIGGTAAAGLRFGHIERLQPLEGMGVELTLKAGDTSRLAVAGEGPPSVAVELQDGEVLELSWSDVVEVAFLPEPVEQAPRSERLHGTVVTRSGLSFTGYVTWDLDEAFEEDFLEGDAGAPIRFGDVASVHRAGSGVRVVTRTGTVIELRGTRDVDASNRGILVADPALGSVTVPFDRFLELRVHGAETPATYEGFDGGLGLHGTVLTEAGERFDGTVRWDRDEARTRDLIDGKHEGLDLHIELSRIAAIEKTWMGATVELVDGRAFYLLASNDVNWTNKGIEVTDQAGTRVVPWKAFARLELR